MDDGWGHMPGSSGTALTGLHFLFKGVQGKKTAGSRSVHFKLLTDHEHRTALRNAESPTERFGFARDTLPLAYENSFNCLNSTYSIARTTRWRVPAIAISLTRVKAFTEYLFASSPYAKLACSSSYKGGTLLVTQYSSVPGITKY